MAGNKMGRILIETERTYVRETEITDIQNRFDLYDSPHMVDFIEPLDSFEEEEEYQKRYNERIYGVYGYGMWSVIQKDTGRYIGEAGLEHRIPPVREKFPYAWMFAEHTSELGFCFAEDLWGQGIATEVCGAIVDYGVNTLGMTRLFARADKANKASVRVLTKLGFEEYGPGMGTHTVYIRV